MRAYDFEYDGVRLSSLGYTICKFDSSGMETISNGSQITFNTVSTLRGRKWALTSTQYDTCIESTFQICKKGCDGEDMELSQNDVRTLSRWLNRKQFHPVSFIAPNHAYNGITFEASFNISKIEVDGICVGLELNMVTNAPFGWILRVVEIDATNDLYASDPYQFTVESDEEEMMYPDYMIVTMAEDGDLTIENSTIGRTTYLENCSNGEVITFKYPVISSTDSTHDLPNDFNWNFPAFANTPTTGLNLLLINKKCLITIGYTAPIKFGV